MTRRILAMGGFSLGTAFDDLVLELGERRLASARRRAYVVGPEEERRLDVVRGL